MSRNSISAATPIVARYQTMIVERIPYTTSGTGLPGLSLLHAR
jgi:hypothetical protein